MNELSLAEKILTWAIPIIFAITVHEVAHGWVASKFGDQTAKMMGRLTLNPIKHIDPIGTILVPGLLLFFGGVIFGWAKPVPVDWRNLRHPRRDMALVALAGPLTNFAMAVCWAVLLSVIVKTADPQSGAGFILFHMARAGVVINIVLMVLNLLPIPPLDGSRVVSACLPPRISAVYGRLEQFGLIIIIILLFTGVLGKILLPAVNYMYELLIRGLVL